MPRKIVLNRAALKKLTSYAHEAPESVSIDKLKDSLVRPKDASQAVRNRFGRSISMDRIEQALISASQGSMMSLTDLSRETIDTDPHLASVLAKRFGAVSSIPWEVHPATGYDIDKAKALYYATVVREQLRNLKNFRQTLKQLAWGLFDGRAVCEVNWTPLTIITQSQYGPIRLVVDCIDWVHPRRLSFGPTRNLQVTEESGQQSGGSFVVKGIPLDEESLVSMGISPRKFIQWTPQLFGEYPEREGLAPRCLYWSFFKRYGQRERMILLELFGKPWRIVEVGEDSSAGGDELSAADEIVDALGASYSARMPRGTSLKVVQPGNNAGQAHKEVIEESDRQISKLVLGQMGTTDGVPAGMNSPQAHVMQDEQLMILQSDAQQLSEVVESQLTDAIIELNFGASELPHAPIFTLRSDLPVDRITESDRLNKGLQNGLRISVSEAYEVSGFRQPEDDEAVLQIEQPPTPPLAPVPPAPRPVIVYPADTSPPVGEQQPPPEKAGVEDGGTDASSDGSVGSGDQAAIITVNEAREAQGREPLMLPDGSLDPDGDLTIEEFRQKKGTDAMEEVTASRISFYLQRASKRVSEQQEYMHQLTNQSCDICCSQDHKQPETDNGTPDDIVDRGLPRLARQSEKWSDEFEKAIDGLENPESIYRALENVMDSLNIDGFAREIENQMIQSVALGGLDSEDELEGSIKATRKVHLAFSGLPFGEAYQLFIKKDIIDKETFKKITDSARRRSFTVAGVTSKQMLDVIHDELGKQIARGADLRKFSDFMRDRLISAGFIGQVLPNTGIFSANHIETVGRTNVLNAYNSGRYAHATQPRIMKARPAWEINAIRDGRSRPAHKKAHGTRLRADDPFWNSAYPPFGFNCRCRVRTVKSLDGVVPGSSVQGLPDRGFTSGVSSLLL